MVILAISLTLLGYVKTLLSTQTYILCYRVWLLSDITLVRGNAIFVMLKLNIRRVFALRGIGNPFSQLVKLGISRPTATNLLNGKVSSINNGHLEKICEFLNCTPDDLYEWTPSANTRNADAHPLKTLRREDTSARYRELLKTIPLDRIPDAEKLLSSLTDPAPEE